MSHKTQILISFSCQKNQIINLNLSQNPSLNNINCSDNPITVLDFSQNPILEFVRCESSLLSYLDFSSNTNLVGIYCSGNALLDSVDLRNGNNFNISFFQAVNNPALMCVYVDNAAYSSTNWMAIDATTTFVETEAECLTLNCVIPEVDRLNDITTCNTYILPNLTNGMYYTESQSNGTLLNPGDLITSSQTIFIYNEDLVNSLCFNESSFNILINTTVDVHVLGDVIRCGSYTLPQLLNGSYFTEPLGGGVLLFSDDVITSSQTIFIYNEDPNDPSCYGESSFSITIIPEVDFNILNLIIEDQDVTIVMSNSSLVYEFAIDTSNYQNDNVFLNLSYGIHELYVRDENQCVEINLLFEIIIPKDYYIPKFFTPNNDGINDYWKVEDYKNVINTISVFNRYGKLLAYLFPENQGWDGVFKGVPLTNNDYWYVISLHSGELIKGHFTLKR